MNFDFDLSRGNHVGHYKLTQNWWYLEEKRLHELFSEGKQVHVVMETSKTNQE